jgi:lysozyme
MIQAGVGFAGIRATMGATGRDEQFKRNWAEAHRAGVQRMAYHYFTNTFAAIPQLNNFLAVLGSDIGELPIVLDVEPTSGQVISDEAANTREIATWLTECEHRIGIRPIIYTNGWAWSSCTTIPDWSATYPLWLAQYTTAPAPKIPAPWVTAKVWQYSKSGNIGGTSPLDLNRYGPYP